MRKNNFLPVFLTFPLLFGLFLLTGCDKTTPAALMGAASVDLPTIVVTGGPMLNGKFRGEDIGSGTDLKRFKEELRAGCMTSQEFFEAEAGEYDAMLFPAEVGAAWTLLHPQYSVAIPHPDIIKASLAYAVARDDLLLGGDIRCD